MTVSKEDYLKAIYKLSKIQPITNKILSNYLGVKPSSVSEMIKKMEESQLLIYENKEIFLTEEGEKIALLTIRKHRVWETFLHNVLDFDIEDVHEEAEKLEHITSDKLLYKLEKYLFFPDDLNHYFKTENNVYTLFDCEVGDEILVINHEKNVELSKYLCSKGIKLKQVYRIVEKNEFDNNIVLESEDKVIKYIGDKASKMIEVYKIN